MEHSLSIVNDLNQIRKQSPLIHNITNYVVMNNSANALLAIGASPVMAHAIEEVEEMVNIASALVINMGTVSKQWLEAMLLAGKKAKSKGIPVIFDPVGVGATTYRNKVASQIIKECKPDIIRGNASEIMALYEAGNPTKGVDSTMDSTDAVMVAKKLALKLKAIIAISGENDYITDGKRVNRVENGSAMMTKVTGMGCSESAIIGAFAAVNSNALDATTNAMATFAICGELASYHAKGPGTLQLYLYDMLYTIDEDIISNTIRMSYDI